MKPVQAIVILVTVKNKRQGQRIARCLLENKLAACVNFVAPVDSMYWWEGKIVADKEGMLVIKTRRNLFKKLEALVKREHSYGVPEIIALPIVTGHKPYLKWLEMSVDA